MQEQAYGPLFSIPWGHIRLLIDKCRGDADKALFYARKTHENNWSRAMLGNFIATDLHERQGRAVTNFETEFMGQLGTYVVAVNHQLKTDEDNPTIGLLVRKSLDKVEAQYALESTSQPIGVSGYELSKLIPEDFKGSLPTVEEIEAEMASTGER